MSKDNSFDGLVQDGMTLPFSGWDFSVIRKRWTFAHPSWDYGAMVRQRLIGVRHLLDMDTGGGEFLASLAPLPPETYATESYPPNILLARQRLEPLGVRLVSDYTDKHLPFENDFFDLVINRHGSFRSDKLFRILRPGGIFLTQQVGGENNIRLNELLQDKVYFKYANWTLAECVRWQRQAGFRILHAQEERPEEVFYDIGAVVFYLRVISWQVEDFSVEKYRDKLYAIHETIQREGKLVSYAHRFLVEAIKD
jgi:SAM-dependent methyltransferase